ncbi:hypothetical protein [Aeromonas taiwanensis]|uniref:hypothetical protein n=1 Tax=Aeromonas taiwanensis TaxID=633417 RepID=UPI003F745FE4
MNTCIIKGLQHTYVGIATQASATQHHSHAGWLSGEVTGRGRRLPQGAIDQPGASEGPGALGHLHAGG